MWSAHCQVKFRVLQCELTRPVPHGFTIISSQIIECEEIQKAMEHFLGMTRDHQRDEPFLTIMSAFWSISCFQLCDFEHTEQCIFLGRTWREVGESHNYLFLLLSMTRGVWLVAHKSVPRRRLCILSWNKGNRRRGHQKTTRNWLSRCSATNDTIKTRVPSPVDLQFTVSKKMPIFRFTTGNQQNNAFAMRGENHARQTQTVPRWVCSHATPCTQRDFFWATDKYERSTLHTKEEKERSYTEGCAKASFPRFDIASFKPTMPPRGRCTRWRETRIWMCQKIVSLFETWPKTWRGQNMGRNRHPWEKPTVETLEYHRQVPQGRVFADTAWQLSTRLKAAIVRNCW